MGDSSSYTDSEEESRMDAKEIRKAKIRIDADALVNFSPPVFPFAQNFEGLAAALELLQELTTITISWRVDPTNVNFRLMVQWMQVAAKVRALPSLTSIEVHASWPSLIQEDDVVLRKYPFADMFYDSLPDKITVLERFDFRLATLFRKRKAPLELVSFYDTRDDLKEDSYYADVFRLKTTRLELRLNFFFCRGLCGLQDCGPLSRNDRLQKLLIWAPGVANSGIPATIRHLRGINAHLSLRWNHVFWLSLCEPSDVQQVENAETATTRYAKAMGAAGFQTKDDFLEIFLHDDRRWRYVSRKQMLELIEHRGWKRQELEGNESTWNKCSFVHDGVRIVVELNK